MIENSLLLISGIFAFFGALGLIRFPDMYTRIHALTMLTMGGVVIGLFSIVAGSYPGVYKLKALLIIIFIILTNPTSSHAIADSAYKTGVKAKRLAKNELK